MSKRSVRDIDVAGKKVLVRVDFNMLVHADGKEELLKSFSCSNAVKETTYYRLRHLMRNIDTKKYQYLGHYREDSDLSENIFYRNYHSLRKIHKI